MNYKRRVTKVILFFIFYLAYFQVYAFDLDYQLDLILANHSNLNQISNPAKEEWVNTLTGTINAVENSSKIIANLNANISVINYEDNQQQDTTLKGLNLNALWIINPKHFEWYILDVYTQTVIDPLQNNTQVNRQDLNVFTTGPNYYWRLSPRSNINFEFRLQNILFDITNGDSDRMSSALRWLFHVNSLLTVSMNVEHEKADYKDRLQNDYTNSSLFTGVEYLKGRNKFIAQFGMTDIHYETQSNISGQRYLLSLQNQRTSNSNISLSVSRNISDTAREITSTEQGIVYGNTSPVLFSADIFTEDNINIQYNKLFSNTLELHLEIENIARNYVSQNEFDSHSYRTSFSSTYNLNQLSSLGLEITQTKTKYDNSLPLREDTDDLTRASYMNALSRNLRGSLSVEFEGRNSTETSRNYKDERVIATLSYILK